MTTLSQAAGQDKLKFKCRGRLIETGPITLWHIMEQEELLPALFGETASKNIVQKLLACTLLQLFRDAEQIPEEVLLKGPKQQMQWVAQQFSLPDMYEANKVIENSMPEEMRALAKKAASQISAQGQSLNSVLSGAYNGTGASICSSNDTDGSQEPLSDSPSASSSLTSPV